MKNFITRIQNNELTSVDFIVITALTFGLVIAAGLILHSMGIRIYMN